MFVIDNFALGCNLILFIGLIVLLFIMRTNPLFDRKQSRLFVTVVFVNLIALLAISLDYTYSVAFDSVFYIPRRVTSFLNFALSPVVPFLFYQIYHKGKINKLLYIPFGINLVCTFLSMWTGIIFDITPKNTYDRGFLFFLPITISFFYIIILMIRPAISHAQKRKREQVFLFIVICLLLLSMFLEVALGLFFLSWNTSALCTILYYLLLNIHSFSLDTLTGVSNRLMYNHALDKARNGAGCIIAMIDINRFKEINDLQGHEAGDECLISFAKILTRCFSSFATLYRIGGDEFVVISKKVNMPKFESCLEKARAEAAAANIEFACGADIYLPIGDLRDTLVKIDQLMYANKAQMKNTAVVEKKPISEIIAVE